MGAGGAGVGAGGAGAGGPGCKVARLGGCKVASIATGKGYLFTCFVGV